MLEKNQVMNLTAIREEDGVARLHMLDSEMCIRDSANTLRLLALPEDLLKLVEEGTLSAGHARAILGAPTQAMQRQAAKQVIAHGLSVRQTESLVKALQKQPAEKKAANNEIALYLGELEKSLSSNLGRKVTISHHGKKGKIQFCLLYTS